MKKVLFFFLLPSLIVVSLAGCLKDPEPVVCTYDACKAVAPAAEIAAVKHYLDSVGISATQHCSGMFYIIDSVGSGVSPDGCQGVNVKYKGMLTNGTVFDAPNTDVALSLENVILGWRNGVPLIKAGGRIRLFIPPSLGYGSKDQYNPSNPSQVLIPANSVLVFEVNLLQVY